MSAQLLDGKKVAGLIEQTTRQQVEQHMQQGLSAPLIAVVLIGADPASRVYVANKQKACQRAGIQSKRYDLPTDTPQTQLVQLIEQLNTDPAVNGILVQLPLPQHIDQHAIMECIDPHKDVDGFHPYNLGRLAQRRPLLRPCTPYGVIQLLTHYQLEIKSLSATVIGASNIVGRPMSLEFLLAGATVTTCHRFTKNLDEHVNHADILVVAAGKYNLVDTRWLKPGCVILDVGIHHHPSGSLHGDIDYLAAKEIASWITPVPGGVGPMTVATLLTNVLLAAKLQHHQ